MRNRSHFRNSDYVGSGYADIIAVAEQKLGRQIGYVAMNTDYVAHWFELPGLPNMQWYVFANTGANPGESSWIPGTEPRLDNQSGLLLGDRTVVILVGK